VNFDILRGLGLPPRCVGWQYEQRYGKATKVCKKHKTGGNASVSIPATWGTLEQAIDGYYKHGFAGIGVVLDGTDMTALDLDKCVDMSTGKIELWAKDIIITANSYTEYSPSYTGIRILTYGNKPVGRCRKGDIEMYNNGRFVTLTGNVLDDGHAVIEHRQDEINVIHAKYLFTPVFTPQLAYTGQSPELSFDDQDLILKACRDDRFQRVWSGSWQGLYVSQSQADFYLINKLIFWCGKDPACIDQLFRQSGLYRPKWERRGAADIEAAISTFKGSTWPEVQATRRRSYAG